MQTLLLTASICAIVGGATAQIQLQSTLVALAPLSGGGGSLPPGPLTNGHLSGSNSSLTWNINTTGTVHFMYLAAGAHSSGFGDSGYTSADLLLTVTATPPGIATIEASLLQSGSAGSPGTAMDVGHDGTFEVPSGYPLTGTENRSFTWDFAAGPLSIRIINSIFVSSSTWYSTSYFSLLQIRVRPWVAGAHIAGPLCSAYANLPGFQTNYALTMEPAVGPYAGELRARGLGSFAVFMVSSQAAALPFSLPLPYWGTCDLLAGVDAFAVGVPAEPVGTTMEPSLWTLPVPLLPPGFTFFLQHASATSTPNSYWFGASNRIRFDT